MDSELIADDNSLPERVTVRARNIGGIDETAVTLHRGITVLSGRNATNRTSLLQATMAALGSDVASLKADAETGTATLEIGDETYTRTLERRNGTVVTDGDPYLDDPELADLFAFPLETNEARRAVARGDDLRELIMRPVDTEAIRAEMEERERRKQETDDRLAELDELAADLPALEERRTQLEAEIDDLQNELASIEDDLDAERVDAAERREDESELEETLAELRATRGELERTRERIQTERRSVEALESERADLEADLDEIGDADEDAREQLEDEIDALRDEKADLDDEISQLQNTIQFNERLLDDPGAYLQVDEDHDADGDVTDRLLADEEPESITCWTCGSTVPESQIETTLEQLRTARKERLQERNEVDARLDERRQRLSTIEDRREERRRTQRRRESIEDELAEREERLENLREDREALTDAVAELEDEIDDLEDEAYAAVLDRHREANELEFEIERTRDELDEVEDRVTSIESQLDERGDLEEEREAVADALTDLRTRIDRIEAEAVEAFNEHMANVLDVLGYENLERIWIDRSTREVREGRRTVTKSSFDLTIVRSTADGAAYEDSIDHLSESEREVTGLVFALAGYLVHEVYETVPFMLLDSLEAIDSARIADLVEYFRSYVPYLVVALLVEDAQAIEVDHETVTEI